MRRSLISAGAALLAFLPLAHAQEPAPCSAAPMAKVKPCGVDKGEASEPAIAMLDGAPITIADLDEGTRKEIEGLDAAVEKARAKALRVAKDDALLAREAKRRGVTVGRLLETEVLAKVAWPTEEEITAEIAAKPKTYKHGKEDAEWAGGILYDRRLAARERAFIAAIEKPIKLDARHSVETAVADVRIDAATDEKSAVDALIHDRLLRAAAQRDGITPEALTQREVTSKVPPPPKEPNVAWLQTKTEVEKTFDDRLRGGHTVRLLFEIPQRPRQSVVIERAPSSGPRAAKVTLVEFGDFECPPCGQMSRVIDEVLPPYAARVRYVFRQFPLSIHRFAWKAAEAALAAQAQGKFFPYAHILFAHQSQLDVASLKRYASQAGLDRERFDADLGSGRYARIVLEDKRSGLRAGVLGTPMFFVNGALLGDDGYTPEGMRRALNAALAEVGK